MAKKKPEALGKSAAEQLAEAKTELKKLNQKIESTGCLCGTTLTTKQRLETKIADLGAALQ